MNRFSETNLINHTRLIQNLSPSGLNLRKEENGFKYREILNKESLPRIIIQSNNKKKQNAKKPINTNKKITSFH